MKSHDSTVTYMSNSIEKDVFKKWRYDAENRDQSQRVIHEFLRKTR